MKLGVISDTHDRTEVVARALAEFQARGVERLIHCGDVTGPNTVAAFAGWQTDFVLGNCDWNPDLLESAIQSIGGTLHQPFGHLELAGLSIAWVHSDDYRLFKSLEGADHYDFLFYGHTHVAAHHQTGKTQVINPGALHRVTVRTVGVLDLPSRQFESIVVG
jgi:putative phosphoesterase